MNETVLDAPTQAKPKRINYALAGVLVGQGVTLAEAARQTGAANSESLRRGLYRKGVTASRARLSQTDQPVSATVTARVVTEATEILRDRLNDGLLSAANALLTKPVTYNKLANRGQGHASTLETLSRTWRNLNGNPDSITFSFGAANQAGPAPVERSTDVVCSDPLQTEPSDKPTESVVPSSTVQS